MYLAERCRKLERDLQILDMAPEYPKVYCLLLRVTQSIECTMQKDPTEWNVSDPYRNVALRNLS